MQARRTVHKWDGEGSSVSSANDTICSGETVLFELNELKMDGWTDGRMDMMRGRVCRRTGVVGSGAERRERKGEEKTGKERKGKGIKTARFKLTLRRGVVRCGGTVLRTG